MMMVMGSVRCRLWLYRAALGLPSNEYSNQSKDLEQSFGFDRIQSKLQLELASPSLGPAHTHQLLNSLASLGHVHQGKTQHMMLPVAESVPLTEQPISLITLRPGTSPMMLPEITKLCSQHNPLICTQGLFF